MATSHYRGWPVVYDHDIKQWLYADNKQPVESEDRPCAHCGKEFTDGDIDPCLGWLQGVSNACCGHGGVCRAYIQNDDGQERELVNGNS